MTKKTITRRGFLKGAAAATAAPLLLPACATTRHGRRYPGPNDRINVAVVGAGWQGTSNMEGFLQNKDCRVIAVCDIDAHHLRGARDIVNRTYENQDCQAYRFFEEMYAREDIDAVSIALPDHWHAIPAIAAAERGFDIYGEKPLAHSWAEGRAIVDAVEKNKCIWQTGSWQRSVENFHHACELVRNGYIGKVHRVEIGLHDGYSDYAKTRELTEFTPPPPHLDYNRWLGPAQVAPYCPARTHKNWRWIMAYGGGRILDWCGHHCDIAQWGLGFDHTGPISAEGTGEFNDPHPLWDAPTHYDVDCVYADGLVMNVSSGNRSGTKWIGEDGWIYVDRSETEASNPKLLEHRIGDHEIRLYKSRNHIANFLECIRTRQQTITPAETAHRSATIGHLCNAAIYTGRKVNWNPVTERVIGNREASAMMYPVYRAPWKL